MSKKIGNEFLREMVRLILDETALIGNGSFVRERHARLIDFAQPKQLEVFLIQVKFIHSFISILFRN